MILPSQCLDPALPVPSGDVIVLVGPYLPHVYRIIPMAEMQHPPVRPSQIAGIDRYVFQVQKFDDKAAVILPDAVHGSPVRTAESASPEYFRAQVVAPRALLHHFIDKKLHGVDPVASRLGKADRGGRQLGVPAYQEMIHPDDPLARIIQTGGDA